MKTVFFDMDGTIADLYGVPQWLDYIKEQDSYPYIHASPLINMEEFRQACQALRERGYKIGVISWLAKGSTKEYDKKVRKAKRDWLNMHSIPVDNLHIVKYGYSKRQVNGQQGDILIDDEENNIKQWQSRKLDRVGIKVDGKNNERIIMNTMKGLINGDVQCMS